MPNYYEILGLAPGYAIDLGDLEARYHERSRLYHPDRHARADGPTRVKNALATSELNQAYRALKDPVKRAEYLLSLHGVKVAEERGAKVDPGFLMEIMELREGLADARMEGDQKRIDALTADVRGRRDRAMEEVDGGFANLDGGDASGLQGIAAALVSMRYYARFLEEIDAHDDRRAEAGELS